MAKNLKLNIKNAQLAEVLKQNKLKTDEKKEIEKKKEELKAKPLAEEPKAEAATPKVDMSGAAPSKDAVKAAPTDVEATSENKPSRHDSSLKPTSETKATAPLEAVPHVAKSHAAESPSAHAPAVQPAAVHATSHGNVSEAQPKGDLAGAGTPHVAPTSHHARPPEAKRPQSTYTPYQGQNPKRPPYERPGQGSSSSYPPRNNAPNSSYPSTYQKNNAPGASSYPPRTNAPGASSYPPRNNAPGGSSSYPPRNNASGSSYPPRNAAPGTSSSSSYPPRYGSPRPPGQAPYQGHKKPDLPLSKLPPIDEKKVDKKKVDKKKPDLKVGHRPGEESEESKAKKATTSLKRQAFSRVFDSRDRSGLRTGDDDSWRRKRLGKQKHLQSPEMIQRPKEISIKLPISVKDLASAMKLKAGDVITKLFLQGLPITINDTLEDMTTIELIGMEFGCKINIDTSTEDRLQITGKTIEEEIKQTPAEKLVTRPPVVTVMGHVDHGKTSIIDAFRKSNIAAGEAGAITQHIGAFQCRTKHGPFTVLDTPGHEAFSAIRQRGANVTDIVVLVIAGDEGIMPQTDEAIDKAKESGVPIIVAINKVDKPGFNVDNVYRQLADRNLLPEAWGGEVICVNCSAKTNEGIDLLGEMIALQSDVLELKADPSARARGTVLESELHRGLGASATLLVQNGTMRVGDAVIFSHEYGRIKTMHDEHGKKMEFASPSTPVQVTGMSGVPAAGNEFICLASEKEARKLTEERKATLQTSQLRLTKSKDIENMMKQKASLAEKKSLNVIIKADVGGSLEALKTTLEKIPADKVQINFISAEVGQISESDISRAEASHAIILGFHTNVESHAESMIKRKKVTILLHDVIYHLVDDVKKHMTTLLDKIREEHEIGEAKVQAVFKSSHLGNIAGCIVEDGLVKRGSHVKIFRGGEKIWEGSISSLKRHQDDVKEVKKGLECGILLAGFSGTAAGDIIKAFEITYKPQEL